MNTRQDNTKQDRPHLLFSSRSNTPLSTCGLQKAGEGVAGRRKVPVICLVLARAAYTRPRVVVEGATAR